MGFALWAAVAVTGCSRTALEVAPAADARPPARCDLASVVIPPGTTPTRAACLRLHHAATVRTWICSAGRPSIDEAFVDTCVALATAPGSTVTAAELDACAASTCEPYCEEPLPCLATLATLGDWFLGTDPLWPSHGHPGALPPGASCVTGLQCDSGWCECAGLQCTDICKRSCARLVPLGSPCNPVAPGPKPIDVCEAGACVSGVCTLAGDPDGTPCVYFDGNEGCQHRCLQPPPQRRGVCAPLGQLGDWCGGGVNPECASGLVCGVGRCIAPQPDGAACETGASCEHSCLDGICGHRRYGREAGDACDPDRCTPDRICVDGRCAPPPPAVPVDAGAAVLEAGAICRIGEDRCPDGQRCWATCEHQGCSEPPYSRCLDVPGEGEPCLPYDQCLGVRVCSGGACRTPSGAGGPCPCRTGYLCSAHGTCTVPGPAACQ